MSLGLGLGVWRGRMNRAVFTPASLPYLGDWHQAVDDGETLVSAAQPVPDDWDMEAEGIAGWRKASTCRVIGE